MHLDLSTEYKKALDSVSSENNIKNIHSRPSLSKVTLSFALGSDGLDKKKLENLYKDMAQLSGSKPMIKYAKFSNAALKIREGQPIAIMATLRGTSMMNFLTKLIYIALPRLRDFRGLKSNFDKLGNITITLPGDSSLFYESNPSKAINVAIQIKRSNPKISLSLLSKIRLPFINA